MAVIFLTGVPVGLAGCGATALKPESDGANDTDVGAVADAPSVEAAREVSDDKAGDDGDGPAGGDRDGGDRDGDGGDGPTCCPRDQVMSSCMNLGGANISGCYTTCDFWCSYNWRVIVDTSGCELWAMDYRPPAAGENAECEPEGDAGGLDL